MMLCVVVCCAIMKLCDFVLCCHDAMYTVLCSHDAVCEAVRCLILCLMLYGT